MRYLLALLSLGATTVVGAAEGMWTLDNLPKAQLEAQYGFVPTEKWVDKVMRASVRLAQGCSGSFVSASGLVMTNHHCALRCIEQLSSAQNDYVRAGYLARSRERELKCPELELNRLEQIVDVTGEVKTATRGLQGEAFKRALNAVQARLSGVCVGRDKSRVRCDVVELYHGGLYHLYRYHRFQDVRVVWAPEQAVAFFGGDPDNFNFPRYDLDVTFLRAYEDGRPVRVKDYFRFKETGAAPAELVFVTGHPGSTQRELTTEQLRTLRDLRYFRDLLLFSEQRGVLQQYQTAGAESARIAAGDLFSIENTIKARRGAVQALQNPELWRKKQEAETALQAFVGQHPDMAQATDAWQALARAEEVYREIGHEHFFIETSRGFMSRYYTFARLLARGAGGTAPARTDPVLHRAAVSRVRKTEAGLVADQIARVARSRSSLGATALRTGIATTASESSGGRHQAGGPRLAQGLVERSCGREDVERSFHRFRPDGRCHGARRTPPLRQ